MLPGGFGEKLQSRRRPTMVCLSLELEKHPKNGASHVIHCKQFIHYSVWYISLILTISCVNEQFKVSTETLPAQTSSRVPSSASQGCMEGRVVQGRCPGTPGWPGWQEGEGPRPTPHPPPPHPCLLSSQESKVSLKARPTKGERGAWE